MWQFLSARIRMTSTEGRLDSGKTGFKLEAVRSRRHWQGIEEDLGTLEGKWFGYYNCVIT